MEGPPPLPRRRRDEGGRCPEHGGRERPLPRHARRRAEEEADCWPPERRRGPPRGESRDGSFENSRWHWRAPPTEGTPRRGGHAWQGPDGPREGCWREGDCTGGRGRPPRRRSCSRLRSCPRRPLRRRGPPPAEMDGPPPLAGSQSRSRSRPGPAPPARAPRARELCRAGLAEMQGEWVDKGGGALYMVSGRTIKRDDGRKFGLHIMRGVIGWGPSGNYYAVPDVSLQEEVRWLSAGSGRAAFVWERPRSPCSERSGGGGRASAGPRGRSGEDSAPVLQ
mmetsp:Transcript_23078/g.65415  ORF Transcript_23078/g.65415 Transcript_23078/m.65415 type:complete len:279 (+) Transcript_23078:688-1524(+)